MATLQVLCAVGLLVIASGYVSTAAASHPQLWRSGDDSTGKSNSSWICHYKDPNGQGEPKWLLSQIQVSYYPTLLSSWRICE